MNIPWPLKTTFLIHMQGEETWIVDEEANLKQGVVSKESPLGKSLLYATKNKLNSYELPDGTELNYMVISIRPRGDQETQFDNAFDYYLDSYRNDSSGIHLNPYMRGVCLECGHTNPGAGEGQIVCENCGEWWYRDHCWNCKKDIDSRDSKIQRCKKCKYWICAHCDSCFCNPAAHSWKYDWDMHSRAG